MNISSVYYKYVYIFVDDIILPKMDKIAPFYNEPSGLLLGSQSNKLSHSLVVQLCDSGREIHIVDCAIRLSPHSVVENSRWADFDILDNIHVQRAFTPYQLLDSLSGLLDGSIGDTWQERVFVFLSPSKQFFDGDVKEDERRHLLNILVQKFQLLRNKGFQIIISEPLKQTGAVYSTYIEQLNKSVGLQSIDCNIKEVHNGPNSRTLFATY